MAILNVNSTRMELNKLKDKLKTTMRGHNLLKNKADGLLREFLKLSKQMILFRKQLAKEINNANLNLKLAQINSSKEAISSLFIAPTTEINIKTKTSNILGIATSSFYLENEPKISQNLNYSFFSNSEFLDDAAEYYLKILKGLIKLAEQEKTLFILAKELEKTRRKVNALENILIPNFKDTIKFITLKLEENERSSIARLSRIK